MCRCWGSPEIGWIGRGATEIASQGVSGGTRGGVAIATELHHSCPVESGRSEGLGEVGVMGYRGLGEREVGGEGREEVLARGRVGVGHEEA